MRQTDGQAVLLHSLFQLVMSIAEMEVTNSNNRWDVQNKTANRSSEKEKRLPYPVPLGVCVNAQIIMNSWKSVNKMKEKIYSSLVSSTIHLVLRICCVSECLLLLQKNELKKHCTSKQKESGRRNQKVILLPLRLSPVNIPSTIDREKCHPRVCVSNSNQTI